MSELRWKIAQFSEIRWWQNYLKGKSSVEYLKWKKAYWKGFLEQVGVTPVAGRDQILDAGCGPAGIFTIFDDFQVDAVDPLVDRYDEKLEHFDKKSYPSTTFITSSLEHFEPQKTYDLIFCINAINHVENLEASMDKLVSCLKPGGKLVISIDAHNHSVYKFLFRLAPFDILHPHQYDLAEYRQMMISRGLDVINEVRCQERYLFDYYALVCSRPDGRS